MAYDVSALEGYFKDAHGKIEQAVPEFAELQRDIPFQAADLVGRKYLFPVFLRRSHGVTWAGSGTAAGSLYTLEDPVSGLSQEAEVSGTELTIQDDIAYGVLSRAQKAGPQAFGDSMDDVTLGLMESMRFYLEMCLLYGGKSIGEIQGRTNDSGTTQRFLLTKASWSPGLWAGMEGAYVDVYDDDFDPLRTTSDAQVTAIDPDTFEVTLTGTEAQLDNIVAGDVIVPRGAYNNWFAGIDAIITNTTTQFGINAATYSLWRGNTKSADSAKLTLAKILAAVTKGVVRGLRESVCVKLNTFAWDDINNDLSAARRFAESTRTEMDAGTMAIKFYGSNGGEISLEPHAMVKAGEAFVFPKKRFKRIGSSDATLSIPGVKGQEKAFYQELESKNGIRLRGYWDQAIVCTAPAKCTKITNINPQSLPDSTATVL